MPPPRSSLSRRVLLGLRVVHPLPSALNALLVVALATAAGATGDVAMLLGLAMLGFQCSIGALNDVVDAGRDRLAKPGKPIPAGAMPIRLAMGIAVAGAALGLAISAQFGVGVLILGAAGLACGLTYDRGMRRRGLGWVCFAAAFPLLLAWTWLAAAGTLPPGWPVLLPLAAIAGPGIHIANSIVDLETDQRVGALSLATSLGLARARRLMALLMAIVYGLAWGVLLAMSPLPPEALRTAIVATALAVLGIGLSWQVGPRARELGWLAQAGGVALMALAWVTVPGS